MVYAVDYMIHAAPESIGRGLTTLVKALYLKRIKRLLDSEPQTVISHLEKVRDSLCSFENFRVLIYANLEKLPRPVSSWEPFAAGLDITKPLNPMDTHLSRISDAGKHPGNLAYIVPMPTIDSSFALATARGPNSYDDPQVPALMVALAYLEAVEGPLWSAVRGTGLAYGVRFDRSVESGSIQFDVYRSPDAYKAFAASRKVIEGFVSGETAFDPPALEGAISTIVVGFANEQSTMAGAALFSFMRQVVRGLPDDWNEKMLKRVREVGVEEIKDVLREVVLAVFMPRTANVVVTCAPIMEEVRWVLTAFSHL